MNKTREWKLGIYIGDDIKPFKGELWWSKKLIKLKSAHDFNMKLKYKSSFIDPTYSYNILKVYLRPIKKINISENLFEVIFEFFHRKN